MVKDDTLPVCILTAGTGQFGHNHGLIVKRERFRTVCNKVHANSGRSDGKLYAVAFLISFAFSGNITVHRRCKLIFLKVAGAAENGNVKGCDVGVFTQSLGLRLWHFHTKMHGNLLSFVINGRTFWYKIFRVFFLCAGEGRECHKQGCYMQYSFHGFHLLISLKSTPCCHVFGILITPPIPNIIYASRWSLCKHPTR